MAYDDIVVGAGLSGLATVMGLPKDRKILVITDGDAVRARFYDDGLTVPCAANGLGGLGNYWHGVIPFGAKAAFAAGRQVEFEDLFARFYPDTATGGRHGSRWLFIPRRPIRPAEWWPKVVAERGGRLELAPLTASSFAFDTKTVTVRTNDGTITASRLWICAGALDTPALLARSLDGDTGFLGKASDHMIVYLGQVDRRAHPATAPIAVNRVPAGYWLETLPLDTPEMLLTARPARFSYRVLDKGIEQRAAFGLPTGGAIAKIARSGSLGLLSEAVFNKFGLFAHSDIHSLYGQIEIRSAYDVDLHTGRVSARLEHIKESLERHRAALDLPEMIPSRRPELFIRGVHLHNTLDPARLASTGIGAPHSPVRVQDASTIATIGGEHHSFHMMVAAFAAARQT